jgi:hypothetical protein
VAFWDVEEFVSATLARIRLAQAVFGLNVVLFGQKLDLFHVLFLLDSNTYMVNPLVSLDEAG